jgi:C4-dicarboxylate transporter DctQ subunit
MRLLRYWNWLEEVVLGWSLLGLALLAFLQVVLRYAFATGLDWGEEFGRYATVFLTFLGASIGVKHGTHFSVEAVVTALPYRASHWVRSVANLLTAVLFAVVVWYGWNNAAKLRRFGVSSASLRVPMWIPYAPIPIFSAALAVRFLLQALQHARRAIDGPSEKGV